jgi:hypothetical protein
MHVSIPLWFHWLLLGRTCGLAASSEVWQSDLRKVLSSQSGGHKLSRFAKGDIAARGDDEPLTQSSLDSLGLLFLAMQPTAAMGSLGSTSKSQRTRDVVNTATIEDKLVLQLPSTEDTFETVIQILYAHVNYNRVPKSFADLPEHYKPQLLGQVPRLLREVFDADFEWLQFRGSEVQNLTCMRPIQNTGKAYQAGAHLPKERIRKGRICLGGDCCTECSRITFPEFATQEEMAQFREEIDFALPEDMLTDYKSKLPRVLQRDIRTALWYIRMTERMRRAIAAEYGLKLSSMNLATSFIKQEKLDDPESCQVHCDEGSYDSFHYSGILYVTSHGSDYEGAGFTFVDPTGDTTIHPQSGSALAFSSGWENLHRVEALISGKRVAIPFVFTTHDDKQTKRPGNADQVFHIPPWRPKRKDALDDDARAEEMVRLFQLKTEEEYLELKSKWHHLFAETK